MTPLFKKLNFKDQKHVVVINSPASFDSELDEMSEFTLVIKNYKDFSTIDFVLVFVQTQEQIEKTITDIFPNLQGDAVLWYCYPKGTSKKYKCDFNRDTGWEVLGTYHLEGVRQVAIDDDWSALRFRKVEFIKSLTRRESFAISKTGKERTAKKP